MRKPAFEGIAIFIEMVLDFSGKLALPVADDNARMRSEIQHLLKAVKFVHHLFHEAKTGVASEITSGGAGNSFRIFLRPDETERMRQSRTILSG